MTAPEYYETSQRMPTEADSDEEGRILVWVEGSGCNFWASSLFSTKAKYWMPMPPAPKTACEREFEAKYGSILSGSMRADFQRAAEKVHVEVLRRERDRRHAEEHLRP